MNDIPLIDFTAARLDGVKGKMKVAREIDRACRDLGFFTASGHGISTNIFEAAYSTLEEFFSISPGEKFKCKAKPGFNPRADQYTPYGYSALLEENALAYMGLMGEPADYVEKFSVGQLVLDDAEPLPFPEDGCGLALRRSLRAYFAGCEEFSLLVLELFAISLGLPANFFVSLVNAANDSLRAHMYPARSAHFDNDQGMGAHTDGTLITLLTHTAPGIQVKAKSGEWLTPACLGVDNFLVNVGDLLEHWTKSQYVSTAHRVVLMEKPRQSIVFFKLTNEDEMVQFGNKQMDALFGRDQPARQ
jgi:isopenicillin N synthase-like dioxygenase